MRPCILRAVINPSYEEDVLLSDVLSYSPRIFVRSEIIDNRYFYILFWDNLHCYLIGKGTLTTLKAKNDIIRMEYYKDSFLPIDLISETKVSIYELSTAKYLATSLNTSSFNSALGITVATSITISKVVSNHPYLLDEGINEIETNIPLFRSSQEKEDQIFLQEEAPWNVF